MGNCLFCKEFFVEKWIAVFMDCHGIKNASQ